MGDSCVEWVTRLFFQGHTHDAVNAYHASRAAFERGNWPILIVTPAYLDFAGHVMRPYHWTQQTNENVSEEDRETWIIYVANPNEPFGVSSPNDKSQCYITVNPRKNTWSFWIGEDGTQWSGGSGALGLFGSGGRMYPIPFSQFASAPELPGLGILASLVGGQLVLCGAAGQTQQISDDSGRTFYRQGLGAAPASWDDIEGDASKRVPGIARFPLLAGQGRTNELYWAQNRGVRLRHDLTARPGAPEGTPYVWAAQSAKGLAAVSVEAQAEATDSVLAEDGGTGKQGLTLSLAPDGRERKVEMRVAGARGAATSDLHWFRIHDLSLGGGHQLKLAMNDAGRNLFVQNNGPRVGFTVSTKAGATRPIELEAGKAAWISPDWDHLDLPWRVEPGTTSLRRFFQLRALPPEDGIRAHFPAAASLRELILSSKHSTL